MLRCFSWPGPARQAIVLVIVGVALSCAAAGPAVAMPARVASSSGLGQATDRGVTSNSIAVGVIGAYGMPLAKDLVTPEVNGLQAAFDAINAGGGVYRRRFVLHTCDDGLGDQASSDACITKLVTQDHIFALVGGVDWGSAGNFPSLRRYQLPTSARGATGTASGRSNASSPRSPQPSTRRRPRRGGCSRHSIRRATAFSASTHRSTRRRARRLKPCSRPAGPRGSRS